MMSGLNIMSYLVFLVDRLCVSLITKLVYHAELNGRSYVCWLISTRILRTDHFKVTVRGNTYNLWSLIPIHAMLAPAN